MATPDGDLERFERFLDEWSRRDFLRGMGGAVALTAFMAGGLELLEACGGGPTTPTDTAKAVRGGHLVEGNYSDVANMNPIFVTDVYSSIVAYRMYEGLLDIDGQANLIPNLATEVPKVESDGMTYRFKLRKDAKWSDGQPITADDVVFTYQLMYDPKYKEVKSRFRAQLEQYLASATAPDPYTVVMRTTTVYAPFLISYGGIGILPKHVWEKLSPAETNSSEMNQVPTVVSGAMAPVRWDKGSQYVTKRNDLWFKGKAWLDSYVYKYVPDLVQAANQLKTGEVDVAAVDPSQWDSMATAQNVDRISYVSPAFDYYIQNHDPAKTPKAAIFGDAEVRKALLTALDRKKIADKVYFGQAVAADSSMSGVQWAHVTPKTQYPFDLSKAESMLDSAGWKKGADGIRTKNGVRMEWELRTNAGNKVRETLITVLADQWKQIGASVTTKPIQFPQLVTQLSSTREFEMILIGIAENPDPDQSQLWSSKSIGNGALNGAGYKSSTVDGLLDQGVQTLDRDKRKKIYAQIQEQLMQDLPAPLLTYPKGLWGVSKRVKNFHLGPWNRYANRPWFKDVYVTDGK